MQAYVGIENARRIQVQQIHFDHQRRRLTGERLRILRDIGYDGGRGEQNYRLGIPDGRGNPLLVDSELRYRKRNSDESCMQRAQERGDVVEPLRGQYRGAVTRRPTMLEGASNRPCLSIHLRPRQTFGWSHTVLGAVDERESQRVRLF